jgi:hypothetical protein
MQTIKLVDFTDYENKDIYAWLLQCNETAFRIVVGRAFVDAAKGGKPDPYEYYDAIYFGEKLSALSTNFSYSVPSEYSLSPFVFELITTDMEKLADTISYLLRPVIAGAETDPFEKFLLDQENFWDQYCHDEIDPVCYGLLHIMEKLLES